MGRCVLLFLTYICLLQCHLYQTQSYQQDSSIIQVQVPGSLVTVPSETLVDSDEIPGSQNCSNKECQNTKNKTMNVFMVKIPIKNRTINVIIDLSGKAQVCRPAPPLDISLDVSDQDNTTNNAENGTISTSDNSTVTTNNKVTTLGTTIQSSVPGSVSKLNVTVVIQRANNNHPMDSSVSSNSTVINIPVMGYTGDTDSASSDNSSSIGGSNPSTGSGSQVNSVPSSNSGSTGESDSTWNSGSTGNSGTTENSDSTGDSDSTGNPGSTGSSNTTGDSGTYATSGSTGDSGSSVGSDSTGSSGTVSDTGATVTAESTGESKPTNNSEYAAVLANSNSGPTNTNSTAITISESPVTNEKR